MELRHLRYFIAVCETLNFTKAAENLNTSQPSLSSQIQDLEYYLKVQLFIRSKRKISLTPEGEIFYVSAKEIINLTNISVNKLKYHSTNNNNKLNFGFLPVAEFKIFPFILPELSKKEGFSKISFHSLNDLQIHEKICDESLDIAISRNHYYNDTYSCELILQEPLVFVYPKEYKIFKNKKIKLKEINGLDFILSNRKTSKILHNKINNFLSDNNINLNSVVETNSILTNLNHVSMGLGCSILPAYCLSSSIPNIESKPLDIDLPTLDIYLIYKRKSNSIIHKEIVSQIKKLFHLDIFQQ